MRNEKGFSLLELTSSLGIIMVMMVGGFKAIYYCQQIYQRVQLVADMNDEARSAIDLAEQEMGQAGLLSSASRTLTAAVTSNASAQSVAISSVGDLFVGEKMLVDTGATQEVVAITSVSSTTVSGVFTKSHAASAPVALIGVFPQGILSSSTSTRLKFYGDVNADGTLVYVEYICDYAARTLTRSVTPIGAGSRSAASILVRDLVANPGGSPCFQYSTSTASGYTFVNQLGITITVQSTSKDPLTRTYLTATKSNLNINPRNIQLGLNLASAAPAKTDRLQPTPPNITNTLSP